MRFILVCTAGPPVVAYDFLFHEWRATCGEAGVDIFLWAIDKAHAQKLITDAYENAYFSDMVLQ
jgi:hypothetical protein